MPTAQFVVAARSPALAARPFASSGSLEGAGGVWMRNGGPARRPHFTTIPWSQPTPICLWMPKKEKVAETATFCPAYGHI